MDKSKLIGVLNRANGENLRMYFITRIFKPGVNASHRVLDKYAFKVYQIETTNEVRNYLYDLSLYQFGKIKDNDDLRFQDYDVLGDETEHLFTYQMKNNVGSFSDVLFNQLNQSPPKITDLNEILQDENLWAYCIEFEIDSTESFYTFRKIAPSKVGVEKDKGGDKERNKPIRTVFDANTKTLSLLKSDTVNLDKKIDCIFYGETFYILQKFNFEQIVGLEEEFKHKAEEIVTSLSCHNCFGDTKFLFDKINGKSSLHKKLLKMEKVGNLPLLTVQNLSRLEELSKTKNAPITLKDRKIQLETDQDVDNVIKLLCDYFKTGDYSGKAYGTFAGKLQPVQ